MANLVDYTSAANGVVRECARRKPFARLNTLAAAHSVSAKTRASRSSLEEAVPATASMIDAEREERRRIE